MNHNKLSLLAVVLIISMVYQAQSITTQKLVNSIIKSNLTKNANLTSLCDKDTNDKACLKSVAGINQCLLINSCYDSWQSQIDVHCWNCWVDYTTDSHIISQFQDNVRAFNYQYKISSFIGLVILFIVAFMY